MELMHNNMIGLKMLRDIAMPLNSSKAVITQL